MPIRLNLLAEAQQLEELRRRDPVKRAILIGVALVLLILAWSTSLFFKSIMVKGDLVRLESNLNSLTNEYRQILQSQSSLVETRQKLDALNRLAANRFLIGNLLNAVQKTSSDNIQMTRLKLDQVYAMTDEVKAKPGEGKTKGKPATARERIILTITAKDRSPTPGDGVAGFQKKLSNETYFKNVLGSTTGFRLVTISATQTDADGKPFQTVTLDAHFPETTR